MKLDPNNLDAYNNLGLLLKNDYFEDYNKAKENYEKAIKIDPNYVQAYYNLAILYKNNFQD